MDQQLAAYIPTTEMKIEQYIKYAEMTTNPDFYTQ